MKKLIALLMVLCMVVGLCACGEQSGTTADTAKEDTTTTEKSGDTVRIGIFSVEINRTGIVRAFVYNGNSAGIGIGVVVSKRGITVIAARPTVKRGSRLRCIKITL